ncbi:MAG: iron-containing alcohol dehydrogenase [Spirochaetales bacterium]|nr:iron-containing alcohol dehydrogenase [Spirochaetales bacterium]
MAGINPFQVRTNGKMIFGWGERVRLPSLIKEFPVDSVLFLAGKSVAQTEAGQSLIKAAGEESRVVLHELSGEPSPASVDEAARLCRKEKAGLVVALGGGSVIDTAKAAAALCCEEGSVKDYLEGVGTKRPSGKTLPMIALPTTGGTGSEATKNAVISDRQEGFKKSLRHDNFIPDVALIDPELTVSCPLSVTTACGLDAFCQLLESYFSIESSIYTDVLAFEGLTRLTHAFQPLCKGEGDKRALLSDMSYAAYLSGVTLANAGLGTVHGIAGPMGGLHDIPHGAACGLLLKPVMELTLKKIAVKWQTERWERKVKRVARLLTGRSVSRFEAGVEAIIEGLDSWMEPLELKNLGHYGIGEEDLGQIIVRSGNKNNPYELTVEEMEEVLLSLL